MAAVPRILFVVPGILAGILVPAVIVSTPKPAPPNTVGMVNMDFSKDVVRLMQNTPIRRIPGATEA
jgi:hypothetical protein